MANVATVTGIGKAKYKANLSGLAQPREGIEKKVAKKVAGRNTMVRTAIVFMEDPSWRAASARALLALATSMLIFAS
jgi:hypothetical protein